MATAKHTTQNSNELDGRKILANLIVELDHLNVRWNPKTHESKRALLLALNKYGALSAKEKARFVNGLSYWIMAAMTDGAPFPDVFHRFNARQLEGFSARMNAPTELPH